MTNPFPPEKEQRSAKFSDCRIYRYHLSQVWDSKKKNLIWLLLNPSTADELQNDPTVERCERRARMWGFGGVEVFNIFAYRATDPKNMKAFSDPIGPDNDLWMEDFAIKSRDAIGIIAWGDHGLHRQRGRSVLDLLIRNRATVYALKVNKSGEPAHPLYLKYDLETLNFPLK